ncbi:MAG TPA: HAD family hydrolase [Candidatus Dormibacteraeota bacterium]|nr:HAD family hydrolase [Candidatus Dormibacteraeota bacterium]
MIGLVFLIDIDNTLLDNDRVKAGMESEIRRLAGEDGSEQFWNLYEVVRRELDYVDVPVTLGRFRILRPDLRTFPQLSAALLGYPFENDLYPRALEVVAHLKTFGTVVILSDGDPVFQPAKIGRIGVADAVDSNVLIFAHKEHHLDEVLRLYPADHYVLIDDKPGILGRIKAVLRTRLTTIHVCQGKYATVEEANPAPDITLDGIADVLQLGERDFLGRGAP